MTPRRSVVPAAALLVAAAMLAPAGAAGPVPIPGPSPSPTPSPVPDPRVGAPAAPSSAPPAPRSATGAPCTVVGTDDPDVLVGTEGADVLCGMGGDDVLIAGQGDDLLDGGPGEDRAVYEAAPAPIVADLSAGTVVGAGLDAIHDIEQIVGTPWDDVLRGTPGGDRLEGGGGTDLLWGRAGDDVIDGGPGSDFLVGDAGTDDLRGGEGADICHPIGEGPVVDCSGPNPRDPRDARGPLDVVSVRTRFGRPRPVWRITTRSAWSTRGIWDAGYVAILLDVREGPGVDRYVIARSTGAGVTAALYRVRPGRDQRLRGRVRAWRRGARSLSIRVPLGRMGIGESRAYFRWGVESIFTGPRCRRVCLDPVPAGDLYAQPIP